MTFHSFTFSSSNRSEFCFYCSYMLKIVLIVIKHLLVFVAFFDWSNWHRVTVDTKSAVSFVSISPQVFTDLFVPLFQPWLTGIHDVCVGALRLINNWCINHSITSPRFRNKLLSLVFMLLAYLSIGWGGLLGSGDSVPLPSPQVILFLLWPVPKQRSILLTNYCS